MLLTSLFVQVVLLGIGFVVVMRESRRLRDLLVAPVQRWWTPSPASAPAICARRRGGTGPEELRRIAAGLDRMTTSLRDERHGRGSARSELIAARSEAEAATAPSRSSSPT